MRCDTQGLNPLALSRSGPIYLHNARLRDLLFQPPPPYTYLYIEPPMAMRCIPPPLLLKAFCVQKVDPTASYLLLTTSLMMCLVFSWTPQLHQLPWLSLCLTSPWLHPVSRLQKTVWSRTGTGSRCSLTQGTLHRKNPTNYALHHKDTYLLSWELAVRAGRHQRFAFCRAGRLYSFPEMYECKAFVCPPSETTHTPPPSLSARPDWFGFAQLHASF
jgi:hypothetical protein